MPEELTLQGLLEGELAAFVGQEEAGLPPAIQYWKTPELMSQEEWIDNENFNEALKHQVTRLEAEGEYVPVPAQLNERLTKALIRNLEFVPSEPQDYEDVQDDVFERFLEKRQMDRAVEELEQLRERTDRAIAELPPDADREGRHATWREILQAWNEELGGHAVLEHTGLYIGSMPPPPVPVDEDLQSEEEQARIRRRNYVWRLGYATVKPVPSRQDTITAEPGTFGRRVMRDAVVDGEGTGSAFLVRVHDRVFPTQAEFSPQRYAEHLQGVVYGDPRRMRGAMRLRDFEGAYQRALAQYFEDMEWMQATFDLQTNSELNLLPKE